MVTSNDDRAKPVALVGLHRAEREQAEQRFQEANRIAEIRDQLNIARAMREDCPADPLYGEASTILLALEANELRRACEAYQASIDSGFPAEASA